MTKENMISRIYELEYYLTGKIIKNRGKDCKYYTGDEYQSIRNELKKLREKTGINKK